MIDRKRRITFEQIADTYQDTRFSYPEELVEDVVRISAISPEGRILEVGCGPGNSTLPFARRGYSILAVELGEKLAAMAVRNCLPYPRVKIVRAAFEEWAEDPAAFDLAISADAFHWVDPLVGFPKLARALKPGAWVALWWNAPAPQAAQEDWFAGIEAAYQQVAPQVENPLKRFSLDWLKQTGTQMLANCGLFEPPQVRHYLRWETDTTQRFIQALRTYSGHAGLDEDLRLRLYAAIAAVIDQHGGVVNVPEAVMLFMARVTGGERC